MVHKLTREQVAEIRKWGNYPRPRPFTQGKLAQMYGVSRETINKVINGRSHTD